MDRVIFNDRIEGNSTQKVDFEVGSLLNNLPAKVLFVVIAGFLFYNVFHSVKITVQKLDILRKARIEVENLRLNNLQLALNLENMQSLEYVEVQARDRLNFAGKNEYVFVIPEDALEDGADKVNTLLKQELVFEKKAGYEIWFEFVYTGI